MTGSLALALCLWVGALASLGLAAQQPAAAVLTGRMVDPSGAAIIGVKVVARHKATGVTSETSTNDKGLYALAGLPSGEYEVRAQPAGFAESVYESVVLQVGQTTALDITARVKGVEERVTITESATPLINTTSATIDGVLTSRAIETLPLNGRNFLELALLVPGNAPAPNFDPTKTNTVVISSAGQLGRGGNVTIDGGDNNDDVVGGNLNNIPQDAVQEFQIATNQFSATLGRSGSSVINVVTKSGGNDLHGTLSAYFRDNSLQRLPATLDRSLGLEPSFDRQQYAGSIGGPLIRDKVWYLGAIEYRNQDGAVVVGRRDLSAAKVVTETAPAPLNDLIGTARVDWRASAQDTFTFRYSLQREDDVSTSTLSRAIGSASQRQEGDNHFQVGAFSWNRVLSPRAVNRFSFSENNFRNRTTPVQPGPQLTFPSLQDGASFRVPQETTQNRLQFSDTLSWTAGRHRLNFGGELQLIDAAFLLEVFQQGRIELVEDFAPFDRNSDGNVNDDDLLFAVTLRSAFPTRPLDLPDADNTHLAFFIQDDFRLTPNLTLNAGLRYELDTDVKNVSRVDELNPLILPFLKGERKRDGNNFAPRLGFNFSAAEGRFSLHGGYGIFYDRITLEIESLERGLDGRALPIEVRAGNTFFIDQSTGRFAPGAPTVSQPFTGFILPGAGAGGINIIDNDMQSPMVQHFTLGVQWAPRPDLAFRADGVHDFGTSFIIGRTIGSVFNPVVGGPDAVKNLESSVKTKYDGLLLSVEKRFSNRYQFLASYTLSKAFNYANDEQIPFANGPINPNNLQLEYGPTPNDQRHRLALSGSVELPKGVRAAAIWTAASGVPMDILLPDGSQRIPSLQRNAGGRVFGTGEDLNAFIDNVNTSGGVAGAPLPLVANNARFNDGFHSFDLRLSKVFQLNDRFKIEPMAEVFNLFNVTNILGTSNVNYSGFANVLVRDSNDSANPGFLRSSSFGVPVTTAGGVFGSGGPRAFQFAVRTTF
jgi:hypothetical protein